MFAKLNYLFLAFFFSLVLVSCTTTVPFSKTTEGMNSMGPYDQELLEKSIMLSLLRFNWIATERNPGHIMARYSKSEGLIIADIKIDYDQDGYFISYEDSKNLDVNLKRMRIHKNYNRWIANLNKSIFEKYIELDS